ncbi:hypothetical protein BH18GEM1_BH18GEM1_21670 [soil metagenome]
MADRARYVVIGSGAAGTRAAETLRRRDRDARIVVVAEDPHPFYNRTLLSKEFLKDDRVAPADLILKPADAYAAQGIELRAGARVVRLDPGAHTIELSGGGRLGYGTCLVASGARPLTLPVPGTELPGVHFLRTLDDALALRSAAGRARRVVVVGGGLIGVEVSAALAGRGTRCALIAREPWLFGHVAPEPVGRALESILRRGGVDLILETTVSSIDLASPASGGGPRLAVRTTGGRRLDADLVPIGVGVRPDAGFLEGTGVLVKGGAVAVDERARSRAPGLYAAGDVAAYVDPVLGARHRVEHWLHAQHHGRLAGLNMTGGDEAYARVSSYDTELFGVPVAVTGAPDLAEEWTERGSLRDTEGVACGLRGGRVVAVYRIGKASDPGAIARMIETGVPIEGAP